MTTALLIWFAVQLPAGIIIGKFLKGRALDHLDYEIKLDEVRQPLSEGGQ